LLAAAISRLDGVGGKPAWAWIFLILGFVAILAGAASFWIIQDFPDTATFLTEQERSFIIQRLQEDDQFSAAGETLQWSSIWKSVSDWKTWVGTLCYAGVVGPLYSFSLFLPTIVNELGFKANAANLLTVPVYVVVCAFTCGVGYWADRVGHRGWFSICFLCVAASGYVVLLCSTSDALSYFGVYLAAM
jgi:MFS family permease